MPAMARCLQDESALIRRHALALISQLLLQDYLKWRGLLLHRYLAILVDRDPRCVTHQPRHCPVVSSSHAISPQPHDPTHSVAEVAEYMLFTPLLRKCPSLFVNHFVEALVVLNGCVDHDSYKAALSQGVRACGGRSNVWGTISICPPEALTHFNTPPHPWANRRRAARP